MFFFKHFQAAQGSHLLKTKDFEARMGILCNKLTVSFSLAFLSTIYKCFLYFPNCTMKIGEKMKSKQERKLHIQVFLGKFASVHNKKS